METEESSKDGQKDVDIQLASSPEEVNSIIARCNEKEEAAKQGPASRPSARASKKIKLDLEQGSPPVLNEKLVGDHFPTTESHSVDREQLLGSVLSENEVNGPQIRSSARVFKKMKLEATAPVTPTTSMVDKKEKKDEPKSEVKRVLSKSLWSHDEKIIFFEAVNEYGRDFENIHLYINNKLKKRGATEDQMKAKDQVRQFYCRMFHEVSRHVKFSNKVKKVVQELYGIINYGELYKKLGRVSEKSCMKLSELIYRGSTVLRSKGRNVRVKTPMCRALRKLNQLDEKYEDLQLPNRVLVEIRPKDMISFLRVQSMAQNPRVRTILPLQKRLNSLLMCLDKRWKTVDAITFEKSVVSSNSITNPCIPPAKESEKNKRIFSPPLRLSPPADAKIELPSINLSDYLTRQTICLTAYESRIGLDTISDPKVMSKKKNLKQKTEVDQRCDAVPIDKALVKVEENEANSCTEAEPDVLADVVDDAVNTILSLQQKLERPDSEQSESEDVKNRYIEKLVPVYRAATSEELQLCPGNWKYGSFFITLLTECDRYLPWATEKFINAGGKINRAKVETLETLGLNYDVVVNCTGLGARYLCNDHKVVPIRGQVYKVRAPWIKTFFYGDYDTYILPGFSNVTLGGCRQYESYNLDVDEYDARSIWHRCTSLVPSLAGAEIVAQRVGLRPHRSEVRLENEVKNINGRVVRIVHNYGHSGYGVTTAPGTSLHACKLVREAWSSNSKL